MTPARSAILVYYMVMGLLYMSMGIGILVFKDRFAELGVAANIMGGACIAYGVFRLYRVFLDYRNETRVGNNSTRPSATDLGA